METEISASQKTQCHPLLELSISTSLHCLAARQLGAISLCYVDRISFSPQR